MEVGKVVYNILSNNATISNLLTTDSNTRIFPSRFTNSSFSKQMMEEALKKDLGSAVQYQK